MTNFPFYSPEYVDKNYLIKLIENKIQENLYLDYKRDLHLDGSDERKEFLYDLSSFANSEGGIIIFGVEEERSEDTSNSGLPGKIIGIQNNSIDSIVLKIESILETSIQPRISNIRIISFEISFNTLLAIIIPKSIGLPHMVTYKSVNRFYKRRNTGKYQVDVYELNQMFMQNNELRERADKFVTDRIGLILKNELNPNIFTSKFSIVHVVPLSFAQNQIPITKRDDYQKIFDHFNSLITITNRHHNYEGYIMYYFSPENNKINSFIQTHRNGIIEFFSIFHFNIAFPNDGKLLFFIDNFEEDCIELVSKSIQYYREIELIEPLLVYINLYGLDDVRIHTKSNYRAPLIIGRSQLKTSPILLKDFESNIVQDLKPAFDVIWQASGIEKSINYNDLGERIKND